MSMPERIFAEENPRIGCDYRAYETQTEHGETPYVRADILRDILSPKHYDKGMDCYVIRANDPKLLDALELLSKIGGDA